MSKFIPNKEHSRTVLIYCFHLKKTGAKSYRLLRKIIVNMLARNIRVDDGFGISKEEDKEHEKPPKNSKRWNYKHCWTKMIHRHKNNAPNNWASVKKVFPIGYGRWERFRRPVDGTTWVERQPKWKAQQHMWYFVRSVQMEVVFVSCSYREWKENLFW